MIAFMQTEIYYWSIFSVDLMATSHNKSVLIHYVITNDGHNAQINVDVIQLFIWFFYKYIS